VDSVGGPGAATAASGDELVPGRPIADPGPNRMVRTATNAVLSAENSLFASTFSWTMVSGSATITNPNSMIATFSAPSAGTYTVRLTVGNGLVMDSKTAVITVDDNFIDTASIRFAHVKNVLQNIQHNGTTKCASCHTVTAVPMPAQTPPIWYNTFDRDGSGGAADATDDAWFLKALQGRVNLTEIEASPLLRKPSGNHHNGGTLFNLSTAAGLQNYSIFYNWILAGTPAGGVASNPVVNGGVTPATVIFSGSPLSTSFTLDGSTSIGATSYLWSVVSGPNGPAGTPPSITNPTSPTATFNAFNVGTYALQLQVSDSVSTDSTSAASL